VVWGESFAENPELVEAPSKLPASTTTEQKRPNAINSSPAEIPTQNSSAETSTNALTPRLPLGL
jgi:hypothetical protein